jgi:FtsZ-binding cell division protein ZapB
LIAVVGRLEFAGRAIFCLGAKDQVSHFIQAALDPPPIWQMHVEETVERTSMIVHSQMTQFMEQHVVDALSRDAHQSKVQGDAPRWRAASPLSAHTPD